jgi:hypothetical protein
VVARKDRARARKRHAIERARREGDTPAPRPAAERERAKPADKRTPGRRTPGKQRPPARGGTANQYAVKGKVGDVTTTGLFGRRQVVRTRDMLVHPRITVRVILAAVAAAVALFVTSLVNRQSSATVVPLMYAVFAVCFLGLADLAPTRRQTIPLVIFSLLSLVLAVAPLLA